MDSPKPTDFMREMERLHQVHRLAVRSKDLDAIDQAIHNMAIFLRYARTGRLQEYFAARGQTEQEQAQS